MGLLGLLAALVLAASISVQGGTVALATVARGHDYPAARPHYLACMRLRRNRSISAVSPSNKSGTRSRPAAARAAGHYFRFRNNDCHRRHEPEFTPTEEHQEVH
jgi:hypothetical protein